MVVIPSAAMYNSAVHGIHHILVWSYPSIYHFVEESFWQGQLVCYVRDLEVTVENVRLRPLASRTLMERAGDQRLYAVDGSS